MITPAQIKEARERLGWSRKTLSTRSNQGLSTIYRAERGGASTHTLLALRKAFEVAGIEFAEADPDAREEADRVNKHVITANQIKAARKLLGWSAATLAKKAGRTYRSVAAAEGAKLHDRNAGATLLAIRTAFEAAGAIFEAENGTRPSVKIEEAMITAAQIREARELVGWTASMLADKARVLTSVARADERPRSGAELTEEAKRRMKQALETAGIEFTNGNQPGVRMRDV